VSTKTPALYIGHGAPLLLDDPVWFSELEALAARMEKPKGILMVSAHWESAPLTVGSVETGTPLIYDFGGFHPKFYELQYNSPGAPEIAMKVAQLLSGPEGSPIAGVGQVHHAPNRGMDHGAYIPLMAMYPDADVPVLQMSIPTSDPQQLFEIGKKLAPLRDEGIMIIGSGFLTHGLPFLKEWSIEATPPSWSVDFDIWAKEALERGAVEDLLNYKKLAPGLPYAHPTVEHFAPIFITLGASTNPEEAVKTEIEGYWMGLAKRSFSVA